MSATHGPKLPSRGKGAQEPKPTVPEPEKVPGPKMPEVMAALKSLLAAKATDTAAVLASVETIQAHLLEGGIKDNVRGMRKTYLASKGLLPALAKLAVSSESSAEVKLACLTALADASPGQVELAKLLGPVTDFKASLLNVVQQGGTPVLPALSLLRSLAAGSEAEAKQLGAGGIVASIIPILFSPDAEPSVQEKAFLVAAEVARNDPPSAMDLYVRGALDAALSGLKASSEGVRGAACWMLDCMIKDTKVLAEAAGHAAALCDAVAELIRSKDETVRYHSLALLEGLTHVAAGLNTVMAREGLLKAVKESFEKKKTDVMNDGIYRLFETLRTHKDSAKVFEREGVAALNTSMLKQKEDIDKLGQGMSELLQSEQFKQMQEAMLKAMGPQQGEAYMQNYAETMKNIMDPANLQNFQKMMTGMLGSQGADAFKNGVPNMLENLQKMMQGGGMPGMPGAGAGGMPGGFPGFPGGGLPGGFPGGFPFPGGMPGAGAAGSAAAAAAAPRPAATANAAGASAATTSGPASKAKPSGKASKAGGFGKLAGMGGAAGHPGSAGGFSSAGPDI